MQHTESMVRERSDEALRHETERSGKALRFVSEEKFGEIASQVEDVVNEATKRVFTTRVGAGVGMVAVGLIAAGVFARRKRDRAPGRLDDVEGRDGD